MMPEGQGIVDINDYINRSTEGQIIKLNSRKNLAMYVKAVLVPSENRNRQAFCVTVPDIVVGIIPIIAYASNSIVEVIWFFHNWRLD